MTRNEYNYFERYQGALNREANSVEEKMQAIAERAEVVNEVDEAAQRDLGENYAVSQKLGAFFKARFKDHRPGVISYNTDVQSSLRVEKAALLWFHRNPEQVAAVRAQYPNRLDVKSMQLGWTAIRKAKAKEFVAGDISKSELGTELFGDDVEAAIQYEKDRLQRAADRAEPDEQPEPAPAGASIEEVIASAPVDVVAKAVAGRKDVLEALVRLAGLAPPPKPVEYDNIDLTLAEELLVGGDPVFVGTDRPTARVGLGMADELVAFNMVTGKQVNVPLKGAETPAKALAAAKKVAVLPKAVKDVSWWSERHS